MILKSVEAISSFIAGDNTIIKELLHPKNEAVDIDYSLALADVEVGLQSEPHILKNQSELYFILQGEGVVYIGEESKKMKKGDFVWIPEGVKQYIVNTGHQTLQFLCIVSPPWSAKDEIILE